MKTYLFFHFFRALKTIQFKSIQYDIYLNLGGKIFQNETKNNNPRVTKKPRGTKDKEQQQQLQGIRTAL